MHFLWFVWIDFYEALLKATGIAYRPKYRKHYDDYKSDFQKFLDEDDENNIN